MTGRPLVCFDFDGVLSEGAEYHWPLTGLDLSPIRQAHERGYAAAIMTCNTAGLVAAELRCHGLAVVADEACARQSWHGGPGGRQVLVTGWKLAGAAAYIDDRALCWAYGQDPAAIWAELDRRAGACHG